MTGAKIVWTFCRVQSTLIPFSGGIYQVLLLVHSNGVLLDPESFENQLMNLSHSEERFIFNIIPSNFFHPRYATHSCFRVVRMNK